jgi:bisphosphoglycerate-independent phosphoglycerate mutase (AlkP superfamily)
VRQLHRPWSDRTPDKADEFILPTVIYGYSGIQDGDGVNLSQFPRGSRSGRILAAIADPKI